jgi:acetylornithine deacetylase/succinyl-diaminopimelate desuccinylase-like protein
VPSSPETYVPELAEWIAIPSVSADPAHQGDVRRAAEWVRDRVRLAGGEADLVEWGERPLVVGEVRASRAARKAPTILCYGHFDVQPPDPLDLWESPPYELVERDGWLFGRGVADDKGQLYMLLKAAELLSAAGELPVNLRFACDGEEEIGGASIVDWLAEDERGADAAVVLDGGMAWRDVPAFTLAVRGLCMLHVSVRTGARDLHSGVYGGAALNAMHALARTLEGVLPRDGRVPEPLRAGVVPPAPEEIAAWSTMPSGRDELDDAGARPSDPEAAAEFYLRTWAEPAVDVHGIAGGSPVLVKTVIPVHAEANVSIRLVGGQDPQEIAETMALLLREAAPAGAEVEITVHSASPAGLVPADARAVQLGLDAFEHVLGRRPLLNRTGGAIPLVSALSEKGVPTILTGFALNESNVHSPNERLLAHYLPLGVETTCELFRRLGALA